ncbi:MAG: two-component system, NtrC family, sensor kinase [Chthoniobacter sp.]|nr:two-component system, NtrC family, sensor kinase [Chthoniobacter sp.]
MDKTSSPAPPLPPAESAARRSEIGLDHPAYLPLLALQKAPHLSELTLGLLHTFNNLFTGVLFLTEECLAREQAGEPVEERLGEILATLRKSHSYVNRIKELHLEEEDEEAGYHELDAVIADQLDLARLLLPRGASLIHRGAGERLTFYSSQRAFCDILLQVIGNCGEALPKRGGAVSISSRPDLDSVLVEIRDNGPGFTPEILERLFVSLCTTRNESRHAGLGLLRCREIARSFGGDLAAANLPEGGAIVTLTLPQNNSQSSR